MKNLSIKIINKSPSIKWIASPYEKDEIVPLRQPKSEWKNHFLSKGKFIINGDKYIFLFSHRWWSLRDYQRQWKEGLKRVETHDQSCLVLNYIKDFGINKKPYIDWLLLYKIKGKIHVQRYSLYDIHEFTPDNCYNFIPPRKTHEEENGEKIPESIVDMKA